jgi:hypothetical protein
MRTKTIYYTRHTSMTEERQQYISKWKEENLDKVKGYYKAYHLKHRDERNVK